MNDTGYSGPSGSGVRRTPSRGAHAPLASYRSSGRPQSQQAWDGQHGPSRVSERPSAPPRRQPERRQREGRRRRAIAWNPLALIPLAIVLALGFGAFSLISSYSQKAAEQRKAEEAAARAAQVEAQRVHPESLGVSIAGISTPKSDWKKGEMPHLYQTDPAWAYKPYGGGTVLHNACGPTALTMVYVYLTGATDYDPGTMSAFSDANNYAPTGATEWAFMTEGAAKIGLRGRTIATDRGAIKQQLDLGRPVICSMIPGDFTLTGHFIVLKSIDRRGMVEVFDPNSAANSARRWPVQRIVNQINNAWAFTA